MPTGACRFRETVEKRGKCFACVLYKRPPPIFILYPALHIIWLSLVIALYVYQHEGAQVDEKGESSHEWVWETVLQSKGPESWPVWASTDLSWHT